MEEFYDKERAAVYYAYLRECGIIGKLNDIFGKLLLSGVLPHNLLNFVREELHMAVVENMERELDDAHREIRRLRGILKELGVNITDKELYEADSTPNEVVKVIDLTKLFDEEMVDQ